MVWLMDMLTHTYPNTVYCLSELPYTPVPQNVEPTRLPRVDYYRARNRGVKA